MDDLSTASLATVPIRDRSCFYLRGRRAGGIIYGFSNQVLFLVTVWYLFWFLRDGSQSAAHEHWLLLDGLLCLQFAVSHSIMLVPRSRRFLTQWIPQPFYDSLFCTVTCLSLLLLFFFWRSSSAALWTASEFTSNAIRAGFYMSWIALFYSLSLTGLGYQNGWTPFWYWLRKQKAPRREFQPRGAYKLIRHPVYLSFLGLIWFTPRMSLDHAALTGIWTAYIFYGSFLKDRRLEFYIGDAYRRYRHQVTGYPFVLFGPLGKSRGGAITDATPASLHARG